MAISTYGELQTAISEWMDRSDVSGKAADFITLAEARLNRLLKVVEADAQLTGTAGSRRIDVSALDVSEAVALWLTTHNDDQRIVIRPDGSFPYHDSNGEPGFAALDDDNDALDFDRPLDAAHTFRLRYRGRFALSDTAPTNRLLREHPDVYLAAALVWGGVFVKDDPQFARMAGMLEEYLAETGQELARDDRGELSVEPLFEAMAGSRRGAICS